MADDNIRQPQQHWRRGDDIVVWQSHCDKRGWCHWQGNLPNMTAKSTFSNKVPGSTLYCFIASGFWRYKCFGIEEKLSLLPYEKIPGCISSWIFLQIQITFPSWPAEVSANIQSGKLRKSSLSWKQISQKFPRFTSLINQSKTSSPIEPVCTTGNH